MDMMRQKSLDEHLDSLLGTYFFMGVGIMEPVENIHDVLTMPAERVVRITDPVTINEYSYKVAQYMIYLQQQHNIYEALYHQLDHRAKMLYARKLSETENVKGKRSVTERKAQIMQDPELVSIYEQMNEAAVRIKLLDDLVDRCNELLNVLKRVHDDLVRERKLVS